MHTGSDAARTKPSGYRVLFVCDIVGFGRRAGRDRVQHHLRATLYAALDRCFAASGLDFGACYREDRGDGAIVVLPPEADPALLVHPLIDHLRGEIRRGNELASDIATMRLRVALHCGRMDSDANGMVGTTVNHACRLLDAPRFKTAMDTPAVDLGVLASAEFHEAYIREGPGAIDPEAFRPIEVRVKETEATAWIRVPGGSPAAPPGAGESVVSADSPVMERPAVPPSTAAPAAGRSDGGRTGRPPLSDLFEVVDRLLDIPLMASAEGREQVVSSLRREIAVRIPRRAQAHLDTHSIVRTCLDFPEGIEEFFSIVRAYAGESAQMEALEETLVRLRRTD